MSKGGGKQRGQWHSGCNPADVGVQKLQAKYEALKAYIKELSSVAVAFSGGVDSTFLLRTAHDVLGDKAVAVTVSSCFFPEKEMEEAKSFCEREGILQRVYAFDGLSVKGFRQNPKNRCYLCKRELFGKILHIAEEQGLAHVAEGSNMDDMGDYRPGRQAIEELSVKSPLMHAGLWKSEIRALSREMGLSTWNKPSFACLASRFPYGEEISEDKLTMVEKAERFLMDRGFRQFRVRIHGNMARIEILPEEFGLLMEKEVREEAVKRLKEYGFSYVTMDLQGYRTGSMNEVL